MSSVTVRAPWSFARCVIVCAVTLIGMLASGRGSADEPTTRRVLRVALYPFLPNRDSLFLRIQEEFEAAHPEIDLRYVDLSSNYYNPAKPNAITNTDADVWEVDSAFLLDLIEMKRIQPMPSDLRQPSGTYLPVAEAAGQMDGTVYGVPHWVCTNYLISLQGDPLSRAKTLADLRAVLKGPRSKNSGLLFDLKGKSTLGEIYLDALMDRDRDLSVVSRHLTLETFDSRIGAVLQEARTFCDSDLCRNDSYHDAEGFYARAFARKQGRALVGYSERLYYVHHEIMNSCKQTANDKAQANVDKENDCIDPKKLVVTPLPLAESGSQPFAWVDMLTISQKCTGQCQQDAVAFVRYVTSAEAVRSALIPGWLEAPRYLLPALAVLYSDKDIHAAAPLYRSLEPAVRNAIPVRGKSLVPNLRTIGDHLDTKVLAQ